jgi:hypothetical protein
MEVTSHNVSLFCLWEHVKQEIDVSASLKRPAMVLADNFLLWVFTGAKNVSNKSYTENWNTNFMPNAVLPQVLSF